MVVTREFHIAAPGPNPSRGIINLTAGEAYASLYTEPSCDQDSPIRQKGRRVKQAGRLQATRYHPGSTMW